MPSIRGPRPKSDSPHTVLSLPIKKAFQPRVVQSFSDVVSSTLTSNVTGARFAVVAVAVVVVVDAVVIVVIEEVIVLAVVVIVVADGTVGDGNGGATVGIAVGATVGIAVGATVGTDVGELVGAGVGATSALAVVVVVVICGGTTRIRFATDVDFWLSNPGIQVWTFKM